MIKRKRFIILSAIVAAIAVLILFVGSIDSFEFGGKAIQQTSKESVRIFYVKADAAAATLSPVVCQLDLSEDKYESILTMLFDGPDTMPQFLRMFPIGSKALSVEVDASGLATVNLNQRSTELNVGAEGEWLAITSIVNSLTDLPEIERVRFLVEGNSVETLVGHVDLTGTFEYDENAVEK